MFKKWNFIISFICLIIFHGQSTVIAIDEELSFYGPTNRGFNSIETLRFRSVDPGPSDNHFTLVNHPAPFLIDSGEGPIIDPRVVNYPIQSGAMGFSSDTVYGEVCPAGSRCYFGGVHAHDSSLQPIIKTRVSAFAIARLTLDSYQEACAPFRFSSRLDRLKVELNPHDTTCRIGPRNAYYERTDQGGQGVINFCSKPVATAKIFDIVSHETGHAILDALNAKFYGHGGMHPYGAIHEAFGDLSPFFASIRLARLSGYSDRVSSLIREEGTVCFAPGLSETGLCLLRNKKGAICEAHNNSEHFRIFFLRSMNGVLNELGDHNSTWTAGFFQRMLVHTSVTASDFDDLYTFSAQMVANVPTLLSSKESNLSDSITRIMTYELDRKFFDLTHCRAG